MQQRLIFIDDDKTLVDILQYYFPRHFECLCLSSPKDIERHIMAFSPHIILMDIYMGVYDGRIICKELKDDARFKHIPIVLTSAASFTDEQLSPYQASAFIPKPYAHLDALSATIRSFAQNAPVIVHNRRKPVTDISLN
jgi:DNA-binding response OmpR family regulator